MHVLRVMDARKGDVAVEFAPPEVKTPEAEKSRADAKAVFEEIMGRGMLVFAVDSAHEGTQLRSFDPSVAEMIAIPQVVGG